MSSQDALQAVQQQIRNVFQELSELEASLPLKRKAGHEGNVKDLQGQLKDLATKESLLQEKGNPFLQARQGGKQSASVLLQPLLCLWA